MQNSEPDSLHDFSHSFRQAGLVAGSAAAAAGNRGDAMQAGQTDDRKSLIIGLAALPRAMIYRTVK